VNSTRASELSGDASMPLTAHLSELRACLIKSAIAVAGAFMVCYALGDRIIAFLTAPLLSIDSPDLTIIGTGVAEAFFAKLKVSFVAAIFFALPVLLWQGWTFVAPGLYENERWYARAFVFFGSFFFLLGAWFCYAVVFDFGYRFFLDQYQEFDIRPAIRISEYLSFSAKLMLAFGVVFELPVAGFFLARVGVLNHRFMISQFRYAFVLIVCLAAVLTPPDVISQILLAVPLTALYGLTILVVYFVEKKRADSMEEHDDAGDDD